MTKRRPCPTPWKTGRYKDRAAAAVAAFKITLKRPHLGTQEPYPCECGKWHTRSAEKRRQRRGGKSRKQTPQ